MKIFRPGRPIRSGSVQEVRSSVDTLRQELQRRYQKLVSSKGLVLAAEKHPGIIMIESILDFFKVFMHI